MLSCAITLKRELSSFKNSVKPLEAGPSPLYARRLKLSYLINLLNFFTDNDIVSVPYLQNSVPSYKITRRLKGDKGVSRQYLDAHI